MVYPSVGLLTSTSTAESDSPWPTDGKLPRERLSHRYRTGNEPCISSSPTRGDRSLSDGHATDRLDSLIACRTSGRLWAHNGLTTMRSSTLVTPGARQATRSASSRSIQERPFPLGVTSPPLVSTVI